MVKNISIFLLAVTVLVVVVYKIRKDPGATDTGGGRRVVDDIKLPKLGDKLDAFRLPWDINRHFEEWPAALPLARLCEGAYEVSKKKDD